ncbi:MAG: hypothetical protein AB1505_16205, partial [Candidatus Latescibacterota bacterium]
MSQQAPPAGPDPADALPEGGGGQASSALLPSKLRYALWRRVDRRLQRGEVLITAEQFQEVMEREFRALVRLPPSRRVSNAIWAMVVAVNEEHPETFLSLGIRNAVRRYLGEMEGQLHGRPAEVVAEARRRLRQLVREGRMAFFLESIGVEVGARGLPPAVEQAIARIIQGEPL